MLNTRPDRPRMRSTLPPSQMEVLPIVARGEDASTLDETESSSSPTSYDVPGSPLPTRLRSNLKRVLLYENVMEDRLLDQVVRKIDEQQQRDTAARIAVIGRIREGSARPKQMIRKKGSAAAKDDGNQGNARVTEVTDTTLAATPTQLPPIILDSNNQSVALPRVPPQSPTEIIRQRRGRRRSLSAGSFLPTIGQAATLTDKNSSKIADSTLKNNREASVSLPELPSTTRNGMLTTRSSRKEDTNSKTNRRPKSASHGSMTKQCVSDDRFKRLQESLLPMSTVRDLVQRLEETDRKTDSPEGDDATHGVYVTQTDDNGQYEGCGHDYSDCEFDSDNSRDDVCLCDVDRTDTFSQQLANTPASCISLHGFIINEL